MSEPALSPTQVLAHLESPLLPGAVRLAPAGIVHAMEWSLIVGRLLQYGLHVPILDAEGKIVAEFELVAYRGGGS